MIRPDDASFCQDESNLSFPSMQYPDGDNDESRGEDTDTSTKYEDSSRNDASDSKTDTEYDDESSFSELSYDGIEFDFGYATYKAARCVCTVREDSVLVEVPEHIWRELKNRSYAETQQGKGLTSGLRQRLKPSHSQTSQMIARALPWPGEKAKSLQDSHHDMTDARTTAPTMPRRRESLSTASTRDKDTTQPLTVKTHEQATSGQTMISHRIPLELQRVFLQSQGGHSVEVPPTNLPAFQEYRCRVTARQSETQRRISIQKVEL
jgi:hypothetical protein